ncbi:MAG: hypothetical protein VB106_04870, partial [Clostridiaceae bacterium]|nr:hypothetical protein [Clostridiaceae bacterium]
KIQEEVLKSLGNVKIQFDLIPEADQDTKMSVALSSGEMSDISIFIGSGSSIVTTYGGTGNLLDFSEYLEYMPNYVEQEKQYPYAFEKLGDKRLVINPINRLARHTVGPVVNTYWLNKLGIKVPTANDPFPWTIDDMMDAMRQVKKAKPDIWSTLCSFFQGSRYLINLSQCYLGQWRAESISSQSIVAVYDYQDTKKWYYPLFTDAFRDMIQLTATMYKEGLIPQDYVSDTMEKHQANLLGTVDQWFISWDFASFGLDAITAMKEMDPSAGAILALPPTTKYQKNPMVATNMAQGAPFNFSIVVNSKTKYPELACSVLDHLISDKVNDLMNWGFEGETYKVVGEGKGFMSATDKEFLTDKYYFISEIPSKPELLDIKKQLGLQYDQMRRMFSHAAATAEGQVAQFAVALQVVPKQMGVDFTTENNYVCLSDNYDYVAKNPSHCTSYILPPSISEEEGKIIGEIYTELNNVVKSNLDKFTTGARPMSEWDDFIKEVKAAGDPQVICDIYNSKEIR